MATSKGQEAKGGPGRPKMPFERIVGAALEIVDTHGADALTLRALAQSMGSSTATLYRHVDSRSDLLGHVVDRVIGEAQFDALAEEGMPWPQSCARLATALFGAIARHPNAAPLLIETIPTGPNAMAFRERCLAVLLAAGFDTSTARAFAATLGRFVIGFAMQLREGVDQAASDERAGELMRGSDPVRYPATVAVGAAGVSSVAQEFEWGLDLLVRGMRDARG